MSKQLKAIAIFAGMIALPILADNLISRRPDIRLFTGFAWGWAIVPIVIFCVFAIPLVIRAFWNFEEDIQGIQGNLKLAERELTKALADNWDQDGRKGKVKERAEWNAMAQTPFMIQMPSMVPALSMALAPSVVPAPSTPETPPIVPIPPIVVQIPPMAQTQNITQTFNDGYRTVAHEAFDLNHKDMANRGTAMGKANMTAILLRELYQGSPGRARKKIDGEFKAGNTPFIAPGIRELLAFGEYDKSDADKEKWGFPEELPGGKKSECVNWIMLTLAVEHGQFPKELVLVDKATLTPEGKPDPFRGWEVVKKLTEPGSKKDWDIPATPEPISMWRLWLKWLTWLE